MNLTDVMGLVGSHKARKRVGRGNGSGSGKTSGRGHKGCKSRAGGGSPFLSEGGQMPIIRRLPKRGFNNANFRTEYCVVNVGDLDAVFDEGTEITLGSLRQVGLIRKLSEPVKVLGDGKLSKKFVVHAHKFSGSAEAKITKAGGRVERL